MRVEDDHPRLKTKRIALAIGALMAFVILIVFGRPAFHLIDSAWRDRSVDSSSTPAGFISDASRMTPIAISQVIDIASDIHQAEAQLAALLKQAHEDSVPVSLAGARHTMGGHIAASDGIVINMLPLNRFELIEGDVLHVQAGARWDQIIPYLDQRGRSIEVMQSNNSFTVGGSISVNCHGWQPNRPPIASTVQSMRIMKADGSIVRCDRETNAELFSLVVGGYGLFGIILDLELRTVPNERYEMRRLVIAANDFATDFQREVCNQSHIGMAYGRLCVSPDRFLTEAVLNVFVQSPCAATDIPPMRDASLTALKRAVFRGSAGSDYGKRLRWDAELMLSDRLAQSYVSRNLLLNDPVELYQDRSATSTDILHEYFVPPEQFDEFLLHLKRIIPQHSLDLLNVTVRHVLEDRDSFLRYADCEMLALVLLFSQQRTPAADVAMEQLTTELIDAALECGGRYYLPYRLHATQQQFERAYPSAAAFFQKKREHDPHGLFQNQFYLRYGQPAVEGRSEQK